MPLHQALATGFSWYGRGRHARDAGGFPEVAYWQGKGYKHINPLPLPVKDVRYLD